MSYDVTVIGEVYLDHVFSGFAGWPRPGAEIFTDQYQSELGGGAVNTACALARLGRSVRLIGVVGKDQFASIKQRLAHFDLSADHLILSEKNTGVTVSVSIAEERTLFSYRGANEDLVGLLESSPELLHNAADSRHIHLAFPLPALSAQHLLHPLNALGATISLDVGHHAEWLQASSTVDVIRAINYLLPNAHEAEVMQGSVANYLRFCQELGVPAIVKLGSEGAAMVVDGQQIRVSAPSVRVVDTTGAGDAFDGGFIHGLLAGFDPRACLEIACICGSLSTRTPGSLAALPTREEIALMKETYAA